MRQLLFAHPARPAQLLLLQKGLVGPANRKDASLLPASNQAQKPVMSQQMFQQHNRADLRPQLQLSHQLSLPPSLSCGNGLGISP